MSRVAIVMPQMGESIVEGTIVAWLKAPGEAVEKDEDVFTLTTDKVDAEVSSEVAGILVEQLYDVGATVEVGQTVAWIETDAAAAAAGSAAASTPAESSAPAEAPTEPTAGAAPVTQAAVSADEADETVDARRRRRSTPLVRRMAEQHGVSDLAAIRGTGVSGRVTKADLLRYIEGGKIAEVAPAAPAPPAARPAAPARAAATTPPPAAAAVAGAPSGYEPAWVKTPRVHVYETDRVEDMTRMRAAIAENMLQARRGSAHCHTVWEMDVTAVLQARKKLRASFEERGVRLTITPFFVSAVVDALRAFPLLNAAIRGNQIVYRGAYNIGVAAAIDDGLIVPVLKGADGLNLMGLARGVNDLGERARTGRLKPDDVADGTFTISNAGIWGALFGVPVLIPPQVGILGIGSITKRIQVDDAENLRIRSMCNMCLSFDHRLIDGATADGFMAHIKKTLATASWDG
jgi:pyruvate dehydrogenase E2 component (dihydrolipoamide acetyltransferase)